MYQLEATSIEATSTEQGLHLQRDKDAVKLWKISEENKSSTQFSSLGNYHGHTPLSKLQTHMA